MKKIAILVLSLFSAYIGAFEAKLLDVVDAKCSNGINIKFKYLGSDDERNVILLMKGEFVAPRSSTDNQHVIHFKDKDGFTWGSAVFSETGIGKDTRISINRRIKIPYGAFNMGESTEIQHLEISK